MSVKQILSVISVQTKNAGFIDITSNINEWIKAQEIIKGILVITIQHTSCSLIINENADPCVLEDLENYLKALVPEEEFCSLNGKYTKIKYLHSEEGLDDMPAHIKTALTASTLSLSINEGKVLLGTWQAIYLWEHRYNGSIRKITLHSIY